MDFSRGTPLKLWCLQVTLAAAWAAWPRRWATASAASPGQSVMGLAAWPGISAACCPIGKFDFSSGLPLAYLSDESEFLWYR
jgi:hypothetical protein